MFEQPEVESPCVNICAMDAETGLCRGCYRTMEEIQGWWDMSFEQKSEVIKKVWARQEAQFD